MSVRLPRFYTGDFLGVAAVKAAAGRVPAHTEIARHQPIELVTETIVCVAFLLISWVFNILGP